MLLLILAKGILPFGKNEIKTNILFWRKYHHDITPYVFVLFLLNWFYVQFSSDDVTGDKEGLRRVAKQVMNKASTKRIISKQEAMVLLADLDLVYCTEIIQSVSISNSKQVSVTDENKSSKKTFLQEYRDRDVSHENLSFHRYFHLTKNHSDVRGNRKYIVPHFVGSNGTPRYPVTDDYARHTLIVYRPWRTYPKDLNWKEEFEEFIHSPICPLPARLTYERVMARFIDKMTHYEAKAKDGDHRHNLLSPEDEELLYLVGLKGSEDHYDFDDALFATMERGIDYDWGKKATVSALKIVYQYPCCIQTDTHNFPAT